VCATESREQKENGQNIDRLETVSVGLFLMLKCGKELVATHARIIGLVIIYPF